jgi:hypothetical protein
MVLMRWGVPLLAAVVVLGPALLPGALFNLDLVLVPRLDLPNGFWGLGPELPRRLPMWVPISWLSPLVPATVSGKLLMVAVFVLAWVGMARLAGLLGVRWVQVAGALYALSPFVLTRTAVGHFMVTVPVALLPWVLPTLLRPGRHLGRTFLAAAALSLGGHFGGSIAIVVVLVGVLFGDRARWWWALLVTLAAQASWLVPALAIAGAAQANLATGAAFGTDAHGAMGLLRLSAGGGFWNSYFQIGNGSSVQAWCGLVLLVLAVVGTSRLPSSMRRPLVALAVIGWFVSAASTMWGLSSVIEWFTGTSVGAVWREPQRVLLLYLLWLAPAAVLGAQRLYDRAIDSPTWLWSAGGLAVLPAVIAAVLALPGLWGIGGQLRAEAIPAGWEQTRSIVRSNPGTVLALPWYQYYNQQIDGGRVRRVLNPMPLYLGGDVLAASNNGLQASVRERADPREPTADVAVRGLVLSHTPIGASIASLGVRWVVLQKAAHVEDYATLASDPGLHMVVDTPDIALYSVSGWTGQAQRADGSPVVVDRTTPALVHFVGGDGAAVVWNHPASGGWRRGGSNGVATPDGRLSFATGSGKAWNVATVPSLLAQLLTALAVVVLAWRFRPAGRHPGTLSDGVTEPLETL